MNKPDFIIIGAMKCATSTIHNQLAAHDSFIMSNPKEPNYFSDDAVYAKGINWYESLFNNGAPGNLKGESSTHYTKLPRYPDTIERLAQYNSGFKFIYIMRHPIDRLVSHYIHEWTQGVISCDINKAIQRHPELIEYGKYNMQIEPYIDRFGHESILPLFSERIKNNPENELQKIFNFLGAREKPVWQNNIKKNVSSERLRVCGWRDAIVNNNLLSFIRRTFVPKKVRTAVKNLWTIQKLPQISNEILPDLQDVFDVDLMGLSEKLNISINCRNYKEKVISHNDIIWTL